MAPKIVRYARLNCACTLDLTRSEWETVSRAKWLTCPKCNAEPVHVIATWKPGVGEEVRVTP